jgi:hypothetical protein
LSQPDNNVTVKLDLELPADRVLAAELDLIEAHLAALIQALLQEDDRSEPKE